MGNQGTCARNLPGSLFPGEGFPEHSPVPGLMGECPLLDIQGNAGSAGWPPAGGKAGRTATCRHTLGAKRHQAWSSKEVLIFPFGKSKTSDAVHRLPGRVSPPSLSGCPHCCPHCVTQHREPETQPEVEAGVTSFTASGGDSLLPYGRELLLAAPALQEGRAFGFPGFRVKGILLISNSSTSTCEVGFPAWRTAATGTAHPVQRKNSQSSPKSPSQLWAGLAGPGLCLAPRPTLLTLTCSARTSRAPLPGFPQHWLSLLCPGLGSPRPPRASNSSASRVLAWPSRFRSYENSSGSPLPVPMSGMALS